MLTKLFKCNISSVNLSLVYRSVSVPLINNNQEINKRYWKMAHSKYQYVRSFETEDNLEPLQWILLRVQLIGGDNAFSTIDSNAKKLQKEHLRDILVTTGHFVKNSVNEIVLAFGYSHVFNFILDKDVTLYKRRGAKLLSNVTSLFSSCFMNELKSLNNEISLNVPVFEGSIYLLPRDQCLRDFLTREQRYCHEINLEKTAVFNLIRVANFESMQALKKVKNSSESEKNEMLFSLCKINYNNEPLQDKKGTIMVRRNVTDASNGKRPQLKSMKRDSQDMLELYKDFSKDEFWMCDFRLGEPTVFTSKLNYVDAFQKKNTILPHTWLIVRIDGKGFSKFSELHTFTKPNDRRALKLMTSAASCVMDFFPTALMAYGQSDEYSFLIRRYGHREKESYSLLSRIVSIFTAKFVQLWKEHFPDQKMLSCPSFDSRIVLYPTNSSLRDYFSWRQADCHINNMYNTCFWSLVNVKRYSRKDSQNYLKGTFTKDKLAILRDMFYIDYSEEDPLFRKGTTLFRNKVQNESDNSELVTFHGDLIGDTFWTERPWILGEESKANSSTDHNIL